ncbi:GNAT family N-acetyltransferase [Glutamicibacter uratoxydans]|uniref:GNAT family N-acetyltransferase n=1 Tax=Glutamicibacter uratoxydans TaxID=43667 RepID=UPI003D6DCC0B
MSVTHDELRLEVFTPELVAGKPSDKSAAFSRAVSRGFYEPEASDEDQQTLTELDIADLAVFYAMYDDGQALPSIHDQAPVGTYLSFPGTMNVGGQSLVPVDQISGVTVAPTHRRRGILRSMITADLQRAREAGMPLAVLTASEATIYGRFGFGLAAERARFELDVSNGATMRGQRTGQIISLAPAQLEAQVRDLLQQQHLATYGSVSNTSMDYGFATGRWQSYQKLTPHKELRAALHVDAQGTVDGFVTYSFAGWEHDPAQLNIAMLCAHTPQARWELIEFLGSHDLIKKLSGRGPLDDVLRSALIDPRSYKIKAAGDHLWLRILDLPAAIAARGYQQDGDIRVKVVDSLGFAAGTWQIQVREGIGSAHLLESTADYDTLMDVRDLATLYLGTRNASHLAGAGVLEQTTQEAIRKLDRLFNVSQAPYCYTDF